MRRVLDTKKLLVTLFVLSVFSLIWRYGSPKPFEVLILVTLILAVVDFLGAKKNGEFEVDLRDFYKYLFFPTVILISSLSGILWSTIKFGAFSKYGGEIYSEYARVIFSMLVLALTAYVVLRSRNAAKFSLFAIVVSPVVLMTSFFPTVRGFFVENFRLIGARNDPNYLATFLTVGAIIAGAYFLFSDSKNRWVPLLSFLYSVPLLLWTGSRAAFLSILVSYFILFILYIVKRCDFFAWRNIFLLFAVISLSSLLSLFVLPKDTVNQLFERIAVLQEENQGVVYDGFSYSRGELWRGGAHMALNSPLGFGFAYHNWSPVGKVGRPHNTFLEVALSSGWIGFIAFMAFLFFVFKLALANIKSYGPIEVALFLSLFYLIFNSFFLDMFTLRWLWLIIGMIIGLSILKKNEETKNISSPSDV